MPKPTILRDYVIIHPELPTIRDLCSIFAFCVLFPSTLWWETVLKMPQNGSTKWVPDIQRFKQQHEVRVLKRKAVENKGQKTIYCVVLFFFVFLRLRLRTELESLLQDGFLIIFLLWSQVLAFPSTHFSPILPEFSNYSKWSCEVCGIHDGTESRKKFVVTIVQVEAVEL